MRLSPASLRPGCRCWKEKGFLRGYRSCLGTAGLLPSRASQGEKRVSCQYDGRLGRWFPGQPLRVPGYTCTQAHVHTHGDTRAHSPAAKCLNTGPVMSCQGCSRRDSVFRTEFSSMLL